MTATEQKPSKPAPGYSSTRQAGEVLYISGTLGTDPETGGIVDGTVEDEIHQMMRNVVSAAEAAGYGIDDIVKTTVYVTDFSFYRTFDSIYRSYFSGPLPARATVQVAGLVAGASIELEAVAVRQAA